MLVLSLVLLVSLCSARVAQLLADDPDGKQSHTDTFDDEIDRIIEVDHIKDEVKRLTLLLYSI